MPFVELTGLPQNCGYTDTVSIFADGNRIGLSKGVRIKYFKEKNKQYAKVFFDVENMLLGIMPSDMGNKVCKNGSIACSALLNYNLITGRFLAKWSDEHKMVIAEMKEKKEQENNES